MSEETFIIIYSEFLEPLGSLDPLDPLGPLWPYLDPLRTSFAPRWSLFDPHWTPLGPPWTPLAPFGYYGFRIIDFVRKKICRFFLFIRMEFLEFTELAPPPWVFLSFPLSKSSALKLFFHFLFYFNLIFTNLFLKIPKNLID